MSSLLLLSEAMFCRLDFGGEDFEGPVVRMSQPICRGYRVAEDPLQKLKVMAEA